MLASASPRRAALLARLGLAPIIAPAAIDETPRRHERAGELVVRLAAAKATATHAARTPTNGTDHIVLGADTEVALDGAPLGKPANADEARAMLGALSGRTHRVVTGVAVRRATSLVTDVARTEVTFRPLRTSEIDWYLTTHEPWGKAGGYAIQGAGAAFVERIEGSDTNVIGLPLAVTLALLRRVDFDPFVADDCP